MRTAGRFRPGLPCQGSKPHGLSNSSQATTTPESALRHGRRWKRPAADTRPHVVMILGPTRQPIRVLVQSMVRRLTAREKLRDDRKSAPMYPAFRRRSSPVHDEIRRVPVLINSSAMEGHLHQQVSGPPFGPGANMCGRRGKARG